MGQTVNDIIGPVHNSHLLAYRQCKQKFKYAFIEGIQPKTPSLPLARGIWLHYCLEAQFLRWGIQDGTLLQVPESTHVDGIGDVVIDAEKLLMGIQVNEEYDFVTYQLSAAGMLTLLIEQVWSNLFTAEHEKYTEDGSTLPEATRIILEEYFYYHREKYNDRKFKILLVEVEWKRAHKYIEFEGRSDYVIEDERGQIVCGDWKSTKSEPHPEYKFMESQLNLYPWGIAPMLVELGVDSKRVENMRVEFDYLSTKLPTVPSKNQDGTISKRKINTTYLTLTKALKEHKLKWTEEQVEDYLANNSREFFSVHPLPRSKRVIKKLLDENVLDSEDMLPLLQDPSRSTRTVTQQCNFRCDFMDLCKGELYDQNVSTLRKTKYEKRKNTHAGVVDNAEE